MFKFKFLILTSLCFVALVLASYKALADSTDPASGRYENEVLVFERRDQVKPPKPGGTVFAGSSTIERWKQAEATFREFDAINRGIGGCMIADVDHYCDRIIIRYKPAKIVFYAGTNDVAEEHTPQRICDDFIKFASNVHAALPNVEIYFISMSMAPSRVQFAKQYESANQMILHYTETTPHMHYIDVTSVMRDRNGNLRKELFRRDDRLHMTRAGYAVWTPIVMHALREPV